MSFLQVSLAIALGITISQVLVVIFTGFVAGVAKYIATVRLTRQLKRLLKDIEPVRAEALELDRERDVNKH